ncbi:Alpha/beta superfamily hydrolase [Halanaeroarchaeum sp. HSR-CO]|uniref:dienelactone hydrolase family protein n=1 Tax=Halanaeroarchaeum sp. HSR-CO TaxID=2866382 RepID=UPI002877DB02|nr:alpha/beta fold hydrolase [Halanaeroarchaeum sp. HSR-CO]UWG46969.1 Alpha/beta superfamily hydrolase [Halanaeroarchaeum sp. HSR-CO]
MAPTTQVTIPTDDVTLPGDLTVPEDPIGLVVFAHGSGSSRKSPRNQFVAEQLVNRGLATLLFDLLTEAEDRDRENRFDIALLTDRLVAASEWVDDREDIGHLPTGYFGSSTGAAAALRAAARRPERVQAVVSRGGRVDLAEAAYGSVTAPTRLVVGGADRQVLDLNREAATALACETEVTVVEGAGHLFEGERELEAVADHAGEWFVEHLRPD